MDSARHVIKRMLNPRFLSYMTCYDVASTMHQSLLRGLDGGGRTVMRVAALSTAMGGAHRVVLEEELRGTSGRVLFNGRYIPTVTQAIPSDHARAAGARAAGAGVGGGGDAMAAWPSTRSLSSST